MQAERYYAAFSHYYGGKAGVGREDGYWISSSAHNFRSNWVITAMSRNMFHANSYDFYQYSHMHNKGSTLMINQGARASYTRYVPIFHFVSIPN